MKVVRNNDAVSEIIGTIAMVAVTVTLAGIVAAYMFGLAGSSTASAPKSVTATAVKFSTSDIVVTYNGGKDSGVVETVTWRVIPDGGTEETHKMGSAGTILSAGTSYTFTSANQDGYIRNTHIVAAAHFSDSSPDQVILDTVI